MDEGAPSPQETFKATYRPVNREPTIQDLRGEIAEVRQKVENLIKPPREGEVYWPQKPVSPSRPSYDNTLMAMAQIISERATCLKGSAGCVIVDPEGTILSLGYNGAPRGLPHCIDVGCLIEDRHCIRTIHAEMNAIISAARSGASLRGSRIVTTTRPCIRCLTALIQAGIQEIVYDELYESDDFEMARYIADQASVTLRQIDEGR